MAVEVAVRLDDRDRRRDKPTDGRRYRCRKTRVIATPSRGLPLW
jgi:hypothetical protein